MNDQTRRELPKVPESGSSQSPPAEEKVNVKGVLDLVRIMASFAVVGGLCLFGVIHLLPPVLGFYLDAKNAILEAFAAGNVGYALGRIAGTLISSGLFFLLLILVVKLLGVIKRTILK